MLYLAFFFILFPPSFYYLLEIGINNIACYHANYSLFALIFDFLNSIAIFHELVITIPKIYFIENEFPQIAIKKYRSFDGTNIFFMENVFISYKKYINTSD